MKWALFEFSKKTIFPQFFKNLSNNINMGLSLVLGINEKIIEKNIGKDVKLFGQDLINITLEAGQYVEERKKYYLVLKIAISSLESRFLFNPFFNSLLMVSTYEVELDKFIGMI